MFFNTDKILIKFCFAWEILETGYKLVLAETYFDLRIINFPLPNSYIKSLLVPEPF